MNDILNQLQSKYNKLGLSRTEMAKELGVSLATFDRMLANGDDLPKSRKIGRQYLFLLTDVARFFEDSDNGENNKKEEPG